MDVTLLVLLHLLEHTDTTLFSLFRYILANIEHTSGLRKGDKIWQLGFGGGFKCNSAVWQARKNVKQLHSCWD
jgi:3-ketoacyl-CoA synthase